MRYLVDGEEEILVRRGAEYVGDGPELDAPEGRVAQEVRKPDLECHDAEHNIFRQGLWPAKLCDLHQATLVNNGVSREGKVDWSSTPGGGDRTSGCALMIASRLVRCGSSV